MTIGASIFLAAVGAILRYAVKDTISGVDLAMVGLIVAVPILSMIVILVEEVWVRPMEAADRARAGPTTSTA